MQRKSPSHSWPTPEEPYVGPKLSLYCNKSYNLLVGNLGLVHSEEVILNTDLVTLITLLQRREAERTEINEEEKYKVFNSFFKREQSISAFALRHKFRKMRRRQKKGHEKGGCYIKFVVVVVRYQ